MGRKTRNDEDRKRTIQRLAMGAGILLIFFSVAWTGCTPSRTGDSVPPAPTVEGNGPRFHHDFPSALAAAQSSGKPMIVIFSASWCGPCKKMKSDVYPSTEVAPYHDSFVWVYLDVDDGRNKALMSKHGVGGIPHIAFLSSAGEPLGKTKGVMSPAAFAAKLSEVLQQAG